MAELESDMPSSVVHLPDQDPSLSLSGSGTSEVNKASFSDEDYQLGKNNILPSSNVSNNFKSNNGLSIQCINESDNPEQTLLQSPDIEDNEKVTVTGDSAEVEIQENIKNEQMSQQHSVASNLEKDGTNEDSVECKSEQKLKNAINENKGSKKKRRIRFPDDSSITDCLDPPDPWKNAPVWTTDELITAYKKSCEINGSKPVVKILQQLHTFLTGKRREPKFVLKGEKLDQKQVECIEEVFRRVQFHFVDLEATHLDDECAVALFDMIEHYESACQLNISFNRGIGARGWQAASRLVRRTPTLTFMDMRTCDLNERTIPIFGRALKMGCHLTVLHMEGMSLTTRPLIILVAALKMNETLQELFLAENKLVPTDGVQLGNLMRYNHKLNLLDLRNNSLQDVGVSHLCDGLVEQKSGTGLRTIVLWNNQISYQAMHALGRALATSTSIETLNIGHNGITNEGVHLLKDGLLKTTSLLRLGLQGTRISDEGGVALAEFIADSSVLLRIDLRDNDIKTGGLMALSHAMRVNNSVTRIDLDKETKKESGMRDYAEVQMQLLRDILTFQERNVQLVMEREEAERTKLEKMAIEAETARGKEKMAKESEGLASATSNIESFTIIEAESVEIPQEAESGDDKEESSFEQMETEVPTSLASVTFSEEEEQMPSHQRPSVLFARMGLQPQESLDSPRTPSDQSDVFQSQQDTSTRFPPHYPSLPLAMPGGKHLAASTPPGEILLSPQYYPKQLARKIFSVSRVSEELCSSPTSPSTEDSCEFDPLNVSPVSLVPVTDSNPLASAAFSLVPAMTQPLAKTAHSPIVSPTTLFQDLANETVKHIVSTEDTDVPSLSSNACLSLSGESESEHTVTLESYSNLPSNCDKKEQHLAPNQSTIEPLSTQGANVLTVENSVAISDLTLVSGEKSEVEIGSLEVNQVSPIVNNGVNDNAEKVCDESILTSDVNVQDTIVAMTNTLESSDGSESHVSKIESQPVIKPEEVSDIVDSNVADENETLSSVPCVSDNVHSDQGTDDSELFLSQNFSTLCNSSSGTENTSSLTEAAKDFSCSNAEKTNIDVHSSNDAIPCSEILPDNLSQGVSACDERELDEETKDKEDETISDGVELDGVELSMEEEPWTALETDETSMTAASSSHSGGEEKQPDFFTTLSMNGLTQELASALTSLDHLSQDCEEDLDVQGPDEFERELESMIAEVQNSSPTSLAN